MPGEEPSGCGRSVTYGFAGAIILGFISFIAGFIGPIIFTPQSNQGPLLGTFITGPAGSSRRFRRRCLVCAVPTAENLIDHPKPGANIAFTDV
ncbi:MAG: hypothetical protein QOI34_1900 [Verrucomicrobiota bacterium]|jgi:hypothetical protein